MFKATYMTKVKKKIILNSIREAAEKNSFLSGPATKRGGGLRGVPLRKKEHFFLYIYIF